MLDGLFSEAPQRLREVLLYEAPPFAAALVIAEVFFKFGSFTLEVIAFLILWRSLLWAYQRAVRPPQAS